ncbi:leucine carboxyl methyltransferase [Marasmius fiardii PR-910]|nr:leucine carboxyl methyltransferase [Marasmius fiardii PR-910]
MLPPPRPANPDSPIQLTDNDAAIARLSAVNKQYISDPFVKALIPRAHLQPSRPPLINIGTHVRTIAIDDLVHQWVQLSSQAGQPCQIVSLGAGSDTRYWRLATGPHKSVLSAYIEIDFSENTTKKAMAIRKSKELSAVVGVDARLALGGTSLHSSVYHLIPADLREPPATVLAPLVATPDGSSKPLLDPSIPTLLLFECVLVYMSPESSLTLIQWFVDYFSKFPNHAPLGSIVYEMFGLEDSFGRVMVSNLKARNVTLPGAVPYPTVQSLPSRFLNLNFTAARALTLRVIRNRCIEPQELDRIAKLEFLDEVEELDLVLEHYAVTWAIFLPVNAKADSVWGHWGLTEKQRLEEDIDI